MKIFFRQAFLLIGLFPILLSWTEGQCQIDPKATPETKNLYANLKGLAKTGTMFGHQDDLAYGVGWKYQDGRSDVRDVAGEYPAVFGWDLGHLELGSKVNLDSVPFDRIRTYVQQVYAQGGVNTFSWHLNNPLDPKKSSWDSQDSTIRHIFEDRHARRRYKKWLTDVADFAKSMKGPNGEAIPVIFRPFHELTGSWFWWGHNHSSPEEYKKMWHFTVDYLRRKKKVHNFLYAYSPDNFKSREDYLERYPGDDYVDILGFDTYHRPESDTAKLFVPNTQRRVAILKQIGEENDKLTAITETGVERTPIADWWTSVLLPIVQDTGLSYVMLWRNGRPDHYYAPYPNQASAEDFKKFAKDSRILMEKRTKAANLYQKN